MALIHYFCDYKRFKFVKIKINLMYSGKNSEKMLNVSNFLKKRSNIKFTENMRRNGQQKLKNQKNQFSPLQVSFHIQKKLIF